MGHAWRLDQNATASLAHNLASCFIPSPQKKNLGFLIGSQNTIASFVQILINHRMLMGNASTLLYDSNPLL